MAGLSDFISNLYLDIDPARPVYQDAAGSILAGIGDPVGYAANQIGATPLTQADTAKKPVLTEDGQGWPCLLFDGVDDYLYAAGFVPGSGAMPWEVTAILTWSAPASVFLCDNTFGRYRMGPTGEHQMIFGGTYAGSASTAPKRIVQFVTSDVAENEVFINGVSSVAAGAAGSSAWDPGINIGRRGTDSYYADLSLWRLLIHNQLTPTERSDLYTYLDAIYNNNARAYSLPLTDPADIGGLAHRFRPHVECYQDAAGTIAAGVGDPVGNLPSSESADSLAQSNTSKKPVVVAGDNGWKAIQTDGVDDALQAAFASSITGPPTVVVVGQPLVATDGDFFTDCGPGASADRPILWAQSGQLYLFNTSGPRYGVPITTGERINMIAVHKGPDSINRVGGVEAATPSDDIGIVSPLPGLTLGSSYQTTSRHINANFYEVLIFDRELNPVERKDLDDYLKAYYDASPPASGLPLSFIHHHLQMMGAR